MLGKMADKLKPTKRKKIKCRNISNSARLIIREIEKFKMVPNSVNFLFKNSVITLPKVKTTQNKLIITDENSLE
jgi:hypothetical protein